MCFGEGGGLIGEVFEDVSRDDEREALRAEGGSFGAATNEADFFRSQAEFVESFAGDDEPAERDVGAPQPAIDPSAISDLRRLSIIRYYAIRICDCGEKRSGSAAEIEDGGLIGDRSDRFEPRVRS